MAADPIRDYIRANIATHTHDAIRAELIAAGHDPARIDTTWAEEWQAFTMDRSVGNLRSLGLSLYVVCGLLGGAGALALAGFASGTTNAALFVIVFLVAYLAIGYGIVRLVVWGVRRFRLGGWQTALLGALLVPIYGALAFGTCLGSAALSQGAR
jgi:uncharacterized membrane protein HdeD (DUF308 family)